ncbi:hypothetical protein FH972_021471 [Carpinus fangiana]|uniref:MutL C-terminal dimerisation domain-containing protein n=1 Tax=Carpinus fangiana TaxID=176857 RepID=A0A5N6KRL7_9ROSI|nr:hypothetical protein FH972_021471 [Carpinus fangiana]
MPLVKPIDSHSVCRAQFSLSPLPTYSYPGSSDSVRSNFNRYQCTKTLQRQSFSHWPQEVRFKAQGLESIEVQDNGPGIAADDYESIARKHHTSKLATYDDLAVLNTFGFRGEALSSLCAVSKFHITTARDGEAPKGARLEFEVSGKLSSVSVAACQKGTIVVVEDLFQNLPVRRRELEKNIKREYSKVLNLLHAYACISTGVRFSITNQMAKGKKVVVFSTNGNETTRENIANVYGAKTITALIPLNLGLQLSPTQPGHTEANHFGPAAQQVTVVGHVSRPVFGEGRQTPDRQMFFVNSRPCGLPQIAKSFNEVYKSFNYTQSPFVFANLLMSTNAYDVNVSPDKRTILLHDQNKLLECLQNQLHNLFDEQDQTMPQSQLPAARATPFVEMHGDSRLFRSTEHLGTESLVASLPAASDPAEKLLLNDKVSDDIVDEEHSDHANDSEAASGCERDPGGIDRRAASLSFGPDYGHEHFNSELGSHIRPVHDFNSGLVSQHAKNTLPGIQISERDDELSQGSVFPTRATILAQTYNSSRSDRSTFSALKCSNGEGQDCDDQSNDDREGDDSDAHPDFDVATRHKVQGRILSSLRKSRNDSTFNLARVLKLDLDNIIERIFKHSAEKRVHIREDDDSDTFSRGTEEERLSLKISKVDFGSMKIIGQFNLGFILAVRSAHSARLSVHTKSDDLFIIDQHASDEIFNFSRLSLTTSLTPQPLVHPHTLNLTAIEEETIIAHKDSSLMKNGFSVAIDMSGGSPVGQRCKLLTVPTSRETVFGLKDLEELLVMLVDAPVLNDATLSQQQSLQERGVLRPSKVRQMLAMRACRSSIMVGRPLSFAGMQRVVQHMGEIERPWNCPHGRPTMRHLAGLGDWDKWEEAQHLCDEVGSSTFAWKSAGGGINWRSWIGSRQEERRLGSEHNST